MVAKVTFGDDTTQEYIVDDLSKLGLEDYVWSIKSDHKIKSIEFKNQDDTINTSYAVFGLLQLA